MTQQAGPDTKVLGIIFVIVGMTSVTIQDVLIKFMSGDYPLHQLVFARSLIGLLITLIIVQFEGGLKILRTPYLKIHLLRGALIVGANMTYFLALVTMPLAEAAALFFVAPLFITMLSIPMLGEKVGVHRWLAIIAGFAGVVIMLRPGSGLASPIVLMPVFAAFSYALVQILTRRVGLADKASTMAFYIQLVFLAFSLCFGLIFGDGRFATSDDPSLQFLFRAWVWPDGTDFMMMVGLGVSVAMAGYCLSQAYRLAPAAVVAPFEYSALPFAVFWGWLVFSNLPDLFGALGIVFILGAGIYIALRERQIGKSLTVRQPKRRWS